MSSLEAEAQEPLEQEVVRPAGPPSHHPDPPGHSTNPVYRWRTLGEFNMLFNALMNSDDLGSRAEEKPITQDGSRR